MASPKALSPTVHAFSTSPHAHPRLNFPSPRSSPGPVSLNRPSSPLSPRSDTGFHAMDLSSPTSPRQRQAQSQLSQQLRQTTQQRRRIESNLQLPVLPRYHPANYPSACLSLNGTPRPDQGTPSGPISPGLQQRVYKQAQQNRYNFKREVLHGFVARGLDDPESVRLTPLGSPGLPMTPLTLDEPAEGYLSTKPLATVPPDQPRAGGE